MVWLVRTYLVITPKKSKLKILHRIFCLSKKGGFQETACPKYKQDRTGLSPWIHKGVLGVPCLTDRNVQEEDAVLVIGRSGCPGGCVEVSLTHSSARDSRLLGVQAGYRSVSNN